MKTSNNKQSLNIDQQEIKMQIKKFDDFIYNDVLFSLKIERNHSYKEYFILEKLI